MSNVQPVELSVSQEFIDDFVDSYTKDYQFIPLGISFLHTNLQLPLMNQVLNQISDIVEDPNQFQILDSLHEFYAPHIDKEGSRTVRVRLNVLCTGQPGTMQFYETDQQYADTDRWVFDTITDADISKMKPIERVDMKYPSLVKPDTYHCVMFDKKDKGTRRIVLSYPFYKHSWEEVCEYFSK